MVATQLRAFFVRFGGQAFLSEVAWSVDVDGVDVGDGLSWPKLNSANCGSSFSSRGP